MEPIGDMVQYRNLKLINNNIEWLEKELHLKGHSQTKGIFYAYVNNKSHSLTVETTDK